MILCHGENSLQEEPAALGEVMILFDLDQFRVCSLHGFAAPSEAPTHEDWLDRPLTELLTLQGWNGLEEILHGWVANGVIPPAQPGYLIGPRRQRFAVLVRLFPLPPHPNPHGLAMVRPLSREATAVPLVNDPVILLDTGVPLLILEEPSATILDCNRAGEQLLGRSRANLVGSPFAHLFEQEAMLPVRTPARTAPPAPGLHPPKDPIMSDIRQTALPSSPEDLLFFDPAGRVRYRLNFLNRPQACLPAETSPIPAQEILLANLAAVVVLDARGMVVFANEIAQNLLDLHTRSACQPLYDLEHWQVSDAQGNPVTADTTPFAMLVRNRSVIRDLEQRIEWPSGRIRYLSINAAPFRDEQGSICGAVLCLHDITETKRLHAEQQALQQRLQESLKLETLGLLAGVIAHDFKNSLTAILGHANLARLELPDDHPLAPALSHIETLAQNAGEMCRQLLDYANGTPAHPGWMHLTNVVREMHGLLELPLSTRVQLQVDLADPLPVARGDETQLRQLVMNLILNAAQAMEQAQGTIQVRTSQASLDATALAELHFADHLLPGEYVYLEVSDTGRGMDAQTLKRIFDPFFTTKSDGRGLGLATVLRMVRDYQGAIAIDSQINAGTTFRLYWPACDPPNQVQATIPTRPASQHYQGVVLVIDDEEAVVAILSRMLETLGFEVKQALSGEEGLTLFDQDPQAIHCVFVDWSLRGLSGAETIEALQQRGQNTPIILMSGYHLHQSNQTVVDPPLYPFLPKPFVLDDVRQLLNRVFG